jgi:hypothetical protein
MAQIVLSDCKLWVGGYDMSAKLSSIALDDNPDMLDNTTFGHTAKSRTKGLDVVAASLAGYWEQEPDVFFSVLGTTGVPMTIAPESAVGGPCYMISSTQNVEYSWGGTVGELNKFNVKVENVGSKMIRGAIIKPGLVSWAISGSSAAGAYGAVGADQHLYGVLHVMSTATDVGDTLDVIIESDDVATFLGTPSTRIAFTQVLGNLAGGRTYQWATPVDGAIADTWWRASWTIVDAGAANASFLFTVAMAIGNI